MLTKLKFSKNNAKLGKGIHTFSLPSGFTCPSALECLSKANKITGKITDGSQTKFRCFSASQEALYPAVRASRWHNLDLLKNSDDITSLILNSLPSKTKTVRIHVAGDFYNQNYFDAWLNVAEGNPGTNFYFYTKSLTFWLNRVNMVGRGHKPGKIKNFVPTASRGGKHDDLIKKEKLREAVVVYSEDEATKLNLEIDHDDTHAMHHGSSFALLLHGTQPKGSEASQALQKLHKLGFKGYSKNVSTN